MNRSKRVKLIWATSRENVVHAALATRRAIIESIEWARDHVDYLVGIVIGLIAIGYLLILLYNKPALILYKKPTGLQGKELQDYLAK